MGGHYVTEGKPPKQGASPFLANTRDRRAIWLSEVSQHKQMHQDLIKAFCEQGGAPITMRKLRRAPRASGQSEGFSPPATTSPSTGNPEDDGFERRTRVLETRYNFVPHPALLMERKADDSLKQRIDQDASTRNSSTWPRCSTARSILRCRPALNWHRGL